MNIDSGYLWINSNTILQHPCDVYVLTHRTHKEAGWIPEPKCHLIVPPRFDDPSYQPSAPPTSVSQVRSQLYVLLATSVPLTYYHVSGLSLWPHLSPSDARTKTTMALDFSACTGACYVTCRRGQRSSNPGRTVVTHDSRGLPEETHESSNALRVTQHRKLWTRLSGSSKPHFRAGEVLMCVSCQDQPVVVRLISACCASLPPPPLLTRVFDPQTESIRSVQCQRSKAYSGWGNVVRISTGLPTTLTHVNIGSSEL
jgi:hypothetical protein